MNWVKEEGSMPVFIHRELVLQRRKKVVVLFKLKAFFNEDKSLLFWMIEAILILTTAKMKTRRTVQQVLHLRNEAF